MPARDGRPTRHGVHRRAEAVQMRPFVGRRPARTSGATGRAAGNPRAPAGAAPGCGWRGRGCQPLWYRADMDDRARAGALSRSDSRNRSSWTVTVTNSPVSGSRTRTSTSGNDVRFLGGGGLGGGGRGASWWIVSGRVSVVLLDVRLPDLSSEAGPQERRERPQVGRLAIAASGSRMEAHAVRMQTRDATRVVEGLPRRSCKSFSFFMGSRMRGLLASPPGPAAAAR